MLVHAFQGQAPAAPVKPAPNIQPIEEEDEDRPSTEPEPSASQPTSRRNSRYKHVSTARRMNGRHSSSRSSRTQPRASVFDHLDRRANSHKFSEGSSHRRTRSEFQPPPPLDFAEQRSRSVNRGFPSPSENRRDSSSYPNFNADLRRRTASK
ncbi:hypothetical protein L484_006200 [Morus notabilis]|uniref:Uncharacterized protein n=1 Tax=Morus notabilis TaxID=981085 RepID=W9QWN5_9ROSA|nr:hypothetical protein L484_006200 [Morus notabilis]